MTRSTHLLSNGDTVWMDSFTGTVVVSSETSNTVVHQNEYLQNVGGSWVRTPGAVQSNVVTTHKIWLKASDGSERDFDFSSVPLALREGHNVSVIWMGKEDLPSSVTVAAINHSAKTRYLLNPANDGFVRTYRALKLKNPGKVQWWVGGAVFFLFVAKGGMDGVLFGLLTGFFAGITAEVLLSIFAKVTSSPVGWYGRGTRLMEQIQQIVETRAHAIEAGSLVVE